MSKTFCIVGERRRLRSVRLFLKIAGKAPGRRKARTKS